MKLKAFVGLMLMLSVTITLFSSVPVGSQYAGKVKIGILGPMAWVHGRTMREAAEIVVDEIMDGGGIQAGGNAYEIELVYADTLRGKPDPDAETGTAAAMELVAAGCDFVLGGFRTEATLPAREVLMDAAATYGKPIYYVAGASTDDVIDCGGIFHYPLVAPGVHCGACVRDNYDRYKYTFRATPMNSTTLNTALGAFMSAYMFPKLMPLYATYTGSPHSPMFGLQVKFALVTEALRWCDSIHYSLSQAAVYSAFTSGFGNLTYNARCSPVETDFTSIINSIKANKAHLIVMIISGPAGRAFVTQAKDLGFDGMIFGIDVPAQEIPTHWDLTGGKCEHESFLTTMGSGQPITTAAQHIYSENMERYGHAPIYTAYGIYDGIRGIKELIEGRHYVLPGDPYYGYNGVPINTTYFAAFDHPYAGVGKWPMTADEMVPIIECTDRPYGILGRMRYHGPQVENRSAWGTDPPNYQFAPILEDGAADEPTALSEGIAAYQTYWAAQGLPYDIMNVNPNAVGSLHDLYVDENLNVWFFNNVRAMVGQWQEWSGQDPALEIVAPTYRIPSQAGGPPAISKKFRTAEWCYAYGETDLAGNPATLPDAAFGWPDWWDQINPLFPHLPIPDLFLWPDGTVNPTDLAVGVTAWQSGAGDFMYDCRADMNGDDFINILDLAFVGMDWGVDGTSEITLYLPGSGTRDPDA